MTSVSKPCRLVKILVCGSSGVGKSCLMSRFCANEFQPGSFVSNLTWDFQTKTVVVGGQRVTCRVFDTAGQERFRAIPPSYFRSADGVLLCFDVTDTGTFAGVEDWVRQIADRAPVGALERTVLVGNKVDLEEERAVSREDAELLAKRTGIKYFDASAKTGDNVSAAFEALILQVLATKPIKPAHTPTVNPASPASHASVSATSNCCK